MNTWWWGLLLEYCLLQPLTYSLYSVLPPLVYADTVLTVHLLQADLYSVVMLFCICGSLMDCVGELFCITKNTHTHTHTHAYVQSPVWFSSPAAQSEKKNEIKRTLESVLHHENTFAYRHWAFVLVCIYSLTVVALCECYHSCRRCETLLWQNVEPVEPSFADCIVQTFYCRTFYLYKDVQRHMFTNIFFFNGIKTKKSTLTFSLTITM